jgi:hypothetical protein
MEIPKEFEGKMVALQLARPVYLFEYGAHATHPEKPAQYLVAQPLMKQNTGPGGPGDPSNPPQASLTDLLLSALVVRVTKDMITVALFDPDGTGEIGNEMHKTIPNALVLSIDEVAGFEVAMPQLTTRRRAPSGHSKLIL